LLSLLLNKKFSPLFFIQFLGAFNDNLFKNALVILITFKLTDTASDTGFLITLAAGLFILPFFLFSSLAGQIADHAPKTELIKKIKLAEVGIMALGAVSLVTQNLTMLLFTLFLMGAQSAFFGPIKYAILPEILDDRALIKGNALFSGSTFIAILLGTIAGGVGVLLADGVWIISVSVLAVAILGTLLSFKLPRSDSADRGLQINWNPLTSTWHMVSQAKGHATSILAVLAISWFWFIGATLLSQIPALVKYNIQGNDHVVVVFMTLFSIGIAMGAGLASAWMKAKTHLRWHWLLLLMMSAFIWLTILSIQASADEGIMVSRETLLNTIELLRDWPTNLSFVFLTLLAVMGGMYIVPLYTLLQTYTPLKVRARMVAVNNVVNSFLMVLSAMLIMIGFAVGLSLVDMFTVLGLINLLVVFWMWCQRATV